MTIDKAIEMFEERYEASIARSDRLYRRVRRPTMIEIQKYSIEYLSEQPYSDRVENVEMIEICLPRDKLPDLIESQNDFMVRQQIHENLLRTRYSSVKKAWEQYQMTLALVDDHNWRFKDE